MRKNRIGYILFILLISLAIPISAYGAQTVETVPAGEITETASAGEITEAVPAGEPVVSSYDGEDTSEEEACLEEEEPAFESDVVYLSGKVTKKKLGITGKSKKEKAENWTSSEPDIVSVDRAGNVRALGIGKAEISVTVREQVLTCTVWAMKPKLSRGVVMVQTGDVLDIPLLGIPEDIPEDSPICHLEWSDSAPSVAQIEGFEDGVLHLSALSKGRTIIRGVYNKTAYKCVVYVEDDIAKASNFRMIKAGDIRENRLFRSTSPIYHKSPNFSAADRLLGENGVNYVINLANKPSYLRSNIKAYGQDFPNYRDLVNSDRYWAKSLRTNFAVARNQKCFAEAVKNIAYNEGPYLFHCRIGRDRTGFMGVLLEGLCNATVEEMEADYMTSWYNYNGIAPGTSGYNGKRGKFTRMLRIITKKREFAPDDTIQDSCRNFFKKYGMTDEEIDAVISNLCDE